jgi:hypothetical protein
MSTSRRIPVNISRPQGPLPGNVLQEGRHSTVPKGVRRGQPSYDCRTRAPGSDPCRPYRSTAAEHRALEHGAGLVSFPRPYGGRSVRLIELEDE